MFKRLQNLGHPNTESCFLWGPRQTGKSTLLKQSFPESLYFDLLLSEEFQRLRNNPGRLREEILASSSVGPVIIDEVQLIPELLNEVQWLMVNRGTRFILCGSSARKLRRSGANLLGGRALRYELFPLVSREIQDFSLDTALNHGLLPRHYLSREPGRLMQAYIGEYLKEEIMAEAASRNIPAFSRFLTAAAFSNGEMVNYQNIAMDCGVSAPTVKAYFDILSDTLLGRFVPAYRQRPKRRIIEAPKFYFFDVGLPNFLLRRGRIEAGGELFGRVFEHFIFQEIIAHSHYSGLSYPVCYWRTANQREVDFVLGDHEAAIEVKGVEEVQPRHWPGLRDFAEDYRAKTKIVVSRDSAPRNIGDVQILPWKIFLEKLWAGEIIH